MKQKHFMLLSRGMQDTMVVLGPCNACFCSVSFCNVASVSAKPYGRGQWLLKLCSHWHFRIHIITKMHESAQHSCTKMLVSKRSVGDALWRHRGRGMLAIVSSSRCLHSSWIGSLTACFWSNILYPLGASCDQSPHPTPPLWSIKIYLFFFVSWPGCPEKLHIAVLGS